MMLLIFLTIVWMHIAMVEKPVKNLYIIVLFLYFSSELICTLPGSGVHCLFNMFIISVHIFFKWHENIAVQGIVFIFL